MTCDLTNPIFTNEEAATAYMEKDRWPNEVICPLCGGDKVHKMAGETQAGMFVCYVCKGKFTVRTGTVFERSHIPLHKWLLAIELMASSKKGISAHQLHRMLGITYKSAWFMAHRIREMMAPAKKDIFPLGGEGKTVEADETYIGGREKNKHKGKRNLKNIGGTGKAIVFSLVERDGKVRSAHVASVTSQNLRKIMKAHVDDRTTLMTDDAGQYRHMHRDFQHYVVNHGADEYARKVNGMLAHTNTAEGFFSILKRGITGCYFHVSEQHLARYLAEFDFRHNTRIRLGIDDAARAHRILKGAEGKRLTYRQVA